MVNLTDLKIICRFQKIPNYSKLKKKELIDLIDCTFAAKKIQSSFRNYFYRNATDCITLEKVNYPCFVFKMKPGNFSFYSYHSIIENIIRTGDTRDPISRIQFSDDDLIRLDNEAKKHNIKYRSTLKIKKDTNYIDRIRDRESEINSYLLRIEELKVSILFAVEFDIFSWNLNDEPILIDNVHYRNINSYINSVLYEIKLIISNLKNYDPHAVECFKRNIVEEITSISDKCASIIKIIEKF